MLSDAQTALAQVREALAAGPTPGPWRVVQHLGYCVDEVITDHPDWQEKPNGNFVAEVSLAAGHEKHGQLFERTAAFIAACSPANIAAILAHVEAQAAEIERLTAERDDLLTKLDAESGSADMLASQCDELRRQLAEAELDARQAATIRGLTRPAEES